MTACVVKVIVLKYLPFLVLCCSSMPTQTLQEISLDSLRSHIFFLSLSPPSIYLLMSFKLGQARYKIKCGFGLESTSKAWVCLEYFLRSKHEHSSVSLNNICVMILKKQLQWFVLRSMGQINRAWHSAPFVGLDQWSDTGSNYVWALILHMYYT